MVVMVTPPAFANIGYKTYIIFAVINFAMVPSVYFFFPETAYRSLEEMDEIFHKTKGFLGTSKNGCVTIAKNMPHRYDKKGNLVIAYEDTEEAQMYAERRRSSIVAQDGRAGVLRADDGEKIDGIEHRE